MTTAVKRIWYETSAINSCFHQLKINPILESFKNWFPYTHKHSRVEQWPQNNSELKNMPQRPHQDEYAVFSTFLEDISPFCLAID